MKEENDAAELGQMSVTVLGKFVYASQQQYCVTAEHYIDCTGIDFIIGAGDHFIYDSNHIVNYHLN